MGNRFVGETQISVVDKIWVKTTAQTKPNAWLRRRCQITGGGGYKIFRALLYGPFCDTSKVIL